MPLATSLLLAPQQVSGTLQPEVLQISFRKLTKTFSRYMLIIRDRSKRPFWDPPSIERETREAEVR